MHADDSLTAPPSPPRVGNYPHSELTQRIIGAAYEVHRELGPGFLEKVYETALFHELHSQDIRVMAQAAIPVQYKEQPVGTYYADLLVEDAVICEVKAIEALLNIHESQLLHHLKATGLTLGLLLNFGTSRVQVKRMVRSL